MNVSTIDEKQKEKYSSYSLHWWDSGGIMQGLHSVNNMVFNHMNEVISKSNFVKEDVKLLDVGCGGGFLAEPLARSGLCVTGIDINDDLIRVAQEHAKLDPSLTNLVYKHESVEEHSVNNPEKYDIIVLSFVLQHAKNRDVLLKYCTKALKPGGLFFITSIAKTFTSWWRIKILGELIYRYIPFNAHNWHNFISPKDVEDILNKNDCVVTYIKGMYFSGLWRRSYWYNDPDGGLYLLLATKKE